VTQLHAIRIRFRQMLDLPRSERNRTMKAEFGLAAGQYSLWLSIDAFQLGRPTAFRESVVPASAPAVMKRRRNPAEVLHLAIKNGQAAHPDPFCIHRVQRAKCVRCTPSVQGKYVYITGGGTAFHAHPDCTALVRGQRKVERRGGWPEQIEAVGRFAAARVRTPCGTCKPVPASGGVSPKRAKPSPAVAPPPRTALRRHRWTAWRPDAKGRSYRTCWTCSAIEERPAS
jgi:hypothetical protein